MMPANGDTVAGYPKRMGKTSQSHSARAPASSFTIGRTRSQSGTSSRRDRLSKRTIGAVSGASESGGWRNSFHRCFTSSPVPCGPTSL